jgi:hypothetical protein
MDGEVAYVQVVKLASGKYVYEARDARHDALETSKQYGSDAAAAQAGADAYGHTYDESGDNVVRLGPPVRHAVLNDGEPEYGEGDGPEA